MTKKRKTVECTLGIRCLEQTARYIDKISKELPNESAYQFRRKASLGTVEMVEGEHADISFISTEDTDREREKVMAQGIDTSQYQLNPVVLFDHDDDRPLGRCAWMKSRGNGVIAKTIYATRPESHPEAVEWFPDTIYALVQQGVLLGKSIGMLPLEVRGATSEESTKGIRTVVERCLLLEYSCVTVPCCQTALVTACNKGMRMPWKIEQVGKALPKPEPDLSHLLDGITFDTDEIVRLARAQSFHRV